MEELKINTYLFTQNSYNAAVFAKIINVNKNSYRIKLLNGEEQNVNKKSLLTRAPTYSYNYFPNAWIPLDPDKLTDEVINRVLSFEELKKKEEAFERAKELIGQAKFFLKQLKHIPEVQPEDDDPWDDDDDLWDDDWDEPIYDDVNDWESGDYADEECDESPEFKQSEK